MGILNFWKNNTTAQTGNSQLVKPTNKRRLSSSINKPQPYQVSMQMSTLRTAVEMARDTINPSWIDLHEIYRNSMTDAAVRSQYEIAVNRLQSSDYIVTRNGKEMPELTKLFDRPWFQDFMRILFDAELWGYTLAEFGMRDANNEFKDVSIFPRTNVYPFNRNIILNDTDTQGFYYGEKPEQFYLLEIGNPGNLGMLELIAREVIWKTFARRDWSELGEKWGKPHLVIKTDAEGEELTKRAAAAANFGNNGYMVTDKDDEIEKLESSNSGNGYLLFEKHIRLANEEIAKLINGQTGTSDDMAYVGSAEVHERILNNFHAARLRRYTNFINYKLIPFLVHHGYPLQDTDRIKFTDLDKAQPKPQQAEKKTPEEVEETPDEKKKAAKAVAAADPLDEWLRRFYKGIDGIDPELWELNYNSLLNAMRKAGVSFNKTYEFASLAKKLNENAAVFAAFKNHDEQQKLTALLVDESGEPRTLNEFLKEAKPLTEQYNREWLKTEFKQAEASAQMAVKWESFAENADLYPNLEYRAVMDSATRDEHRKLNGLIAPLNDPIWNSIYPPNGWGCRCNVTQTDKEVNKAAYGEIKPDKGFEFNPGKEKKLFDDHTGYAEGLQTKLKTDLEKQGKTLLKNRNNG